MMLCLRLLITHLGLLSLLGLLSTAPFVAVVHGLSTNPIQPRTPPTSPASTTTTANGASSGAYNNNTRIDLFQIDVNYVLNELRNEELDLSLKEPFGSNQRLSYTTLWDLNTWETHTSRTRYIRDIWLLPQSRLLQRILPNFILTLVWAILTTVGIDTINLAPEIDTTALADFDLSLTSLALISGFVATLLTLRSNQGLDRLNESRKNLEKAVLHVKDSATLVVSYIQPNDPLLADIYCRYLSIFAWSMKCHLRESLSSNAADLMGQLLHKKLHSHLS